MRLDAAGIAEAKEQMAQWLSDPRELGAKPSQMEYVDSFTDEDEITCHIFKYKKSLFSKWMIGIVSDSGVFSDMKEFRRDTAVQDAMECLNWLKSYWKNMAARQAGEENAEYAAQRGVFSGFVLLADKEWDKGRFCREMESDWGISVREEEKSGQESGGHCDAMLFEVGTQRVVLGYMDIPVPDGEAEHNAAFNYTWKEAVEVTKTHQAQIVVTILGGHEDIKKDGELFVKVVATLCQQRNTIGVYANGVVYQPQFYLAMRELIQKGMFPVLGLVWFGIRATDKGCSVYTIGMNCFGKDEMEILDSGVSLQELKDFLIDVATYCIEEDVTLHDGENIGVSASQRCRITRSKGVWTDGMTLKIEFEKSEKSR